MIRKIHKKGLISAMLVALLTGLLLSYPPIVLATSSQPSATVPTLLKELTAEVERLPLATGVQYSAYNLQQSGSRQAIKVLNVDTKDEFTLFETILAGNNLANTREKPTVMATELSQKGRAAVAATNGDFYSTKAPYLPIGMQISNGELLISPQGFPALGLDKEGQAFIAVPNMEAHLYIIQEKPGLQGEGKNKVYYSHPINHVNRERGADMLVLYTPAFAPSTATNDYGIEITLQEIDLPLKAGNTYKGVVAAKTDGQGDNVIPRNGLVLSGHGQAKEFLQALDLGDQVELMLKFSDPRWHEVEQAIGGRDLILWDGEIALPMDTKDSLITSRHPRTAVGLKEDGTLEIVVVDGRQPGYSDGMTLFELADFMRKRGVLTALNLDGGGSTVLAARNVGETELTLFNRPIEGQERAVSSSLAVFSSAPKGELSYLYLLPAALKVFQGSRVQFTLRAQDNYFNPMAVPEKLTWRQKNDLGSFVDQGLFKAERIGQGEVIAMAGDLKASSRITVVDRIDRLEISPAIANLQPGDRQQFSLTAYDADGDPIMVDTNLYQWTITEGLGRLDPDSGSLQVNKAMGDAQVRARLGGQEAAAIINPALSMSFEDQQPLAGQEISLKVEHNGLPVEKATVRQISPAVLMGEVTASALNMRSGPGTEQAIIALLPKGQNLVVLEELANNWLRVRLADGRKGYVSAEYILLKEGEQVLGQTDSQGRVGFIPQQPGIYKFTAAKEGYLGGDLEIEIKGR